MRQKLTPVTSAVVVLSALLALGMAPSRATTFMQFQSTYLGSGWFQYQMSVFKDPFFTEADITGLSVKFPSEIDQSTSTNWNNTEIDSSYSTWSFTNGIPAPPYQETFLVQSSDTSYKLDTNGAIVVLSLILAEFEYDSVVSGNIVGFARMPGLVPCPPEEADNSPTNYVFTLKLLPDVAISQLIQTNGNIYGVDFMWDAPYTFLLQGSADMNNWTNAAYIWSWPPETLWTTNQPLNSYGNFFRLAVVSGTHNSNLPPLNSALAAQPKTVTRAAAPNTPRVTSCQFASGKVSVNVTAQAGQTVQVQAVDSHRAVQQTQQIVAGGTSATVNFDAASLPSPVYFQATTVAPR